MNRKNKQLAASALALSMLVSGTFAWQSFSQRITNETAGFEADQGTRLHNYFDGSNADVFVENYASEDSGATAFTRVKVLEYMEIGSGAGTVGDRIGVTASLVRGDISTTTPDIDDKTTWDTYLHQGNDGATSGEIRDYLTVNYGDKANSNEGSAVFMPTFDKNYESLAAQINGTLLGSGTDRFDSSTHYDDYVSYTVGQSVEGTANYHPDATVAKEYGDVDVPETHTATNTLSGSVISMDTWMAGDQKAGDFWVYDVDGWAYWGNGLAPATATCLLIDSITTVKTPDADWYYGIHVINDSATVDGWLDAMSLEATEMSDEAAFLMGVMGVQAEIYSVSIKTATGTTPSDSYKELTVGESVTFTATVAANSSSNLYQGVDWSIVETDSLAKSSVEGFVISDEGVTFTPVEGMEGKDYTITAESKVNGEKAGEVTVSVIDTSIPEGSELTINNVYIRTSTGNIPTESYLTTAVGGAIALTSEVATSEGNDVYQNVKWEISGNSVSSDVLQEGVFTPVAGMEGKSYTVKVTSLFDNTKSATTTVTVSNVVYTIDSVLIRNASGFAPSASDLELEVGGTSVFTMAAYSSLGYETNQDATWTISSSDSKATQAVMNTSLANGEFVPASSMEGATYTIAATSKVDTSKSNSVDVYVINTADTSEYEITSIRILDATTGLGTTTNGRQTTIGSSIALDVNLEATDSRNPELKWSIAGAKENATDLSEADIDATFVDGVFTPVTGMEGNTYTVTVESLVDTSARTSISLIVLNLTSTEIENASISIELYTGYTGAEVEQAGFIGFQGITTGLTVGTLEWHVEGNDSPQTVADVWQYTTHKRGGLSIGADETVGNKLTVYATSTVAPSVRSNEMEFTVTAVEGDIVVVPGASGNAIVGTTSTVTMDGVEFYVLAKEAGEVLLWSKNSVILPKEVTLSVDSVTGISRAYFHNRDLGTTFWEDSYMRTDVLPAWLDTMPSVKEKAIKKTLVTQGLYNDETSIPTTARDGEETSDSVHLLSQPEFLEYVGLNDDRATATDYYWLRSAGVESYVRRVNGAGTSFNDYGSSGSGAVRPAFWISL